MTRRSDRWADRTNRRTMTEYEAQQCDRANVRIAEYVRWHSLHPGAAYEVWARRVRVE